ncbi:MAG: hypothetical protein HC769_11525 [Cyanobacteria bacterium CRU_2_1]|nr:hypothetical protein [Cyanobacteria bacterium CRU_2_1]
MTSCSKASPDIEAAIKTLQTILREEGFLIKDASGYFVGTLRESSRYFRAAMLSHLEGNEMELKAALTKAAIALKNPPVNVCTQTL